MFSVLLDVQVFDTVTIKLTDISNGRNRPGDGHTETVPAAES